MKKLFLLLISIILLLIWSAIRPKEYFTWFLEVLPAIIGIIILVSTFKKFPMTPLLYFLIFIQVGSTPKCNFFMLRI